MGPSTLFSKLATDRSMLEPFNPSSSLTALEQGSTVIAVTEMSQSKWLVAAVIPGIERRPLKKLDPDEEMLLKLLHRWQNEARRAGHEIKASSSPMRLAATASGWLAGCRHAVSRPT
jgi:transposase